MRQLKGLRSEQWWNITPLISVDFIVSDGNREKNCSLGVIRMPGTKGGGLENTERQIRLKRGEKQGMVRLLRSWVECSGWAD